ncbi:hypothetical protein VOLCADRAFT_99442, partial [Volvox carteri f. nagariensis]
MGVFGSNSSGSGWHPGWEDPSVAVWEEDEEGPDFSDFLTGRELAEKYSVEAPSWTAKKRKPDWMKRSKLPGGEKYTEIKAKLRELKLSTVCEEARCPNLGRVLGGRRRTHRHRHHHADGRHVHSGVQFYVWYTLALAAASLVCGSSFPLSRPLLPPPSAGPGGPSIRFCAVKTSKAPAPLDPNEPENVSKAIAAWGLDYVVLTSVDRDDLPDGGAAHIASTIRLLKQKTHGSLLVEALVPDFQGNMDCVKTIVDSGLDVYAHNIETVERLQVTKSSIMLGCGESQEEVVHALKTLRAHGVDVVTLGQYMRPTKKHMAVSEFVTPEAFKAYEQLAQEMGFLYVASGPM